MPIFFIILFLFFYYFFAGFVSFPRLFFRIRVLPENLFAFRIYSHI